MQETLKPISPEEQEIRFQIQKLEIQRRNIDFILMNLRKKLSDIMEQEMTEEERDMIE